MATFHAIMLICSLAGSPDGAGCTVLEGPGSPFEDVADCQKSVDEGKKVVTTDPNAIALLEEDKATVYFACHPTKDGKLGEEDLDTLIKLYGPPVGDDS